MNFRLVGLLALVVLLTGCAATVPIRPYYFIQQDREPNAPHVETPVDCGDGQVS